jgi:hypothetical protein
MKRLLFIFVVFSAPCFAANTAILPDKPEPQYQAKVHTANREFWIEAGALGTAWTLDTVSTHNAFAANSTRHEAGYLFKGSRSVPKIMGAWAAVDIGAAVAAYEWKKHVKNRYLHPLWRVPMLVGTMEHDQAAAGNWTLRDAPVEVTNSQPDLNTVSDPRVRQSVLEPLRVPRTIRP